MRAISTSVAAKQAPQNIAGAIMNLRYPLRLSSIVATRGDAIRPLGGGFNVDRAAALACQFVFEPNDVLK
jgi:hypothetical protein